MVCLICDIRLAGGSCLCGNDCIICRVGISCNDCINCILCGNCQYRIGGNICILGSTK